MARKRMFDAEILSQDSFLDISLGAKAIYFLLGMSADDEGFISPKQILKLYDGNDAMLDALIEAGFLIKFDSGIVLISDWHRNNWLDKRRAKETIYVDEKKDVEIDEESLKYKRISTAKQMLRENSIDKNSIEENRIAESSIEKNILDQNRKEENSGEEIYCPVSQDNDISHQIIDYLNLRIGTSYKYTEQSLRLIQDLIDKGYKADDFKIVIDKKYQEWFKTDMEKYLRPATLFGDKFEQYLNQLWVEREITLDDVSMDEIDAMIEKEQLEEEDYINDPFAF